MNHQKIQEKFILLLDNQVSESERISIQSHIEACSDCREFFEGVSRVWDDVPVQQDAPQYLWTRFQARLQASKTPSSVVDSLLSRLDVWARPAFMVVTLTIGIFIGSYIGSMPEAATVTANAQIAGGDNDAVLNAFYPESLKSVSPEMVDLADMEVEYVSR